MQFNMPTGETSIIKVIGVGGGGSNAVTHMFKLGIVGVDFAVCNTDNQAMELSPVPTKIQLGPGLTEGRGAGSKPTIGKEACEESIEEIKNFLVKDTKMLFVTAGMGGGTGTGAAPVIAQAAQELDILTVGIVTLPFTFEGRRRQRQAQEGLEELKKNVDTLIVISNDKLRQIHGNLPLSQAFGNADNILSTAAKGIAEIITVPGYINVDFEDVNTVMRNSGVAIMGTSAIEGEERAKRAVEAALNSPLLADNDIRGAQHILLNITSGNQEVTMDEIFEITEYVQDEAGYGTDLIWGNCYDESLGDKISVTVIATGFEIGDNNDAIEERIQTKVHLNDVQNTHIPKKNKNAVTYEFETPKPQRTQRKESRFSYDEPYVKREEKVKKEKERLEQQKVHQKRNKPPVNPRKNKLRNLSVKLNNPQTINELESEPAYIRRNIKLDDVPHSSKNSMSRWSLNNDDNNPELKEGNSFLHDNVD